MAFTVETGTKRGLDEAERASPPPAKRHCHWEGREVSEGSTSKPVELKITPKLLKKYHTEFISDPRNLIVRNALAEKSFKSIALNRIAKIEASHHFSDLIEIRPRATDQKSSGRCWLFAAMNTVRVAMIEKYNLPTSFEFSQNHLFFYDKIEKANLFLNRMIQFADKPLDDDDVSPHLGSPVYDGGGWTMFKNLITKYGLMPQSAMPDSYQSTNSATLNSILNYQLRQFTLELREMKRDHKPEKEIRKRMKAMMGVVYRIVADHLGEPPRKFTWEYTTKKGQKYQCERNLKPLEFYKEWVPYCAEEKVLLINMPSERTPYNSRYAGWCDSNMEEGETETYLNLPYDAIIPALIRSIKAGEPVYFSCDVKKHLHLSEGVMDTNLYDYELLFNTPFAMNKEERVKTKQSHSSHAMVLCGVNIHEEKPNRWCVENSWGRDGDDGYLSMSHDWFLNYTFKFAIDRKYLTPEIQNLAELEPVPMTRKDPI